jgi:CheY-like chemotaxis protein
VECINKFLGTALKPTEDITINCRKLAGKKILIVDDFEINHEILSELFVDTGVIIDSAFDGQEAVDIITQNPYKYDLVFMDVQMPNMDGIEATRIIRNHPEMSGVDLPIIAITTNVRHRDIDECRSAGMNDHIGKPLDLEKVLTILRKYL